MMIELFERRISVVADGGDLVVRRVRVMGRGYRSAESYYSTRSVVSVAVAVASAIATYVVWAR